VTIDSQLVLANPGPQFEMDVDGTKVLNASSFDADSSFAVLRPASNELEFSRIDLPSSEDGADGPTR
jgi:hypothetical protein